MGIVLRLLLGAVTTYLEKHPEEIEKLAEFLIKEAITAIQAHQKDAKS